ncbi:MAG: family 20 glycosylhydrolase [Clostridia bacterium]|nr:family 20 glycosylhydrolase [Clostridia bacterium]
MVLPRVKEEKYLPGYIHFPKKVRVFDPSDGAEKFIEALRIIFPEREFVPSDAGTALIRRETLPAGRSEEYGLSVGEDGDVIIIRSSDHPGAVHAAAVLRQLAESERVPRRGIRDLPDNRVRSVMIDMPGGDVTSDELKAFVLRAALARYSQVHLHLLDAGGLAYLSEVYPQIPHLRGAQYTLAQLKELRDFCETLGLKLVGSLEFPNHAPVLLKVFPELACDCRDGKRSAVDWSVCLNNDAVFKVMKDLILELDSVLPCEYVNIFGDEPAFPDHVPPMMSEWCHCERCSGLGKNDSERYQAFARRVIEEIVRPMGKKLMLDNDTIDVSRPVDLPKEDVVISFWRIALPGRGPVEGCSMEKFLEQGFEVLNINYVDCYFDLPYGMTEESLSLWNPKQLAPPDSTAHKRISEQHPEKLSDIPFAVGEAARRIIGAEMNLWGCGTDLYRNHYSFTLPGGFYLFGDRMWNDAPLPMDENTRRALSKAVLGEESEMFSVFGEALIPVPAVINDGQALVATLPLSLPNEDPAAYRELIPQLERLISAPGLVSLDAKAYLRLIREALKPENEKKPYPFK